MSTNASGMHSFNMTSLCYLSLALSSPAEPAPLETLGSACFSMPMVHTGRPYVFPVRSASVDLDFCGGELYALFTKPEGWRPEGLVYWR
jgi:hypothetical protein